MEIFVPQYLKSISLTFILTLRLKSVQFDVLNQCTVVDLLFVTSDDVFEYNRYSPSLWTIIQEQTI